ncbi:MAG: thiamine phosphate synthase, partial [Plesiomonas sp.]
MFARCFLPNETAVLGFYPVVDSVPLLRQLLALGVTTLQLRIKQPALSLENTIT